MANYYTHFSTYLTLRNADQVTRAIALAADEKGCLGEPFYFQIEPAHDEDAPEHTLWIHADENGTPEDVSEFVKQLGKEFGFTHKWGFEWGNWCDKERLDCFGGGAFVIDFATGKEKWCITSQWLMEELA